ncbi:MAG: peptidase M16 [Flavobacteriales bacterium]|nr:peptidase M16 [Flavobacteriales bacterium]|tara:strand:- start:35727 stop:38567 length:2841 start_codon:yes stop_codon:yes gene_type:complete
MIKFDNQIKDPINTKLYTLDNGLKVFLSRNINEPRIHTNIAVCVGSKHDPKGLTGLAHCVEHMLFKGTTLYGTTNYSEEKKLLKKIEILYDKHRLLSSIDIKKKNKIWQKINDISLDAAKLAIPNEYDKMLSAIGAKNTNAYTSFERTVYINDIPSNQLEKWIKLESDRFRFPVFRLFSTELESIYEEKNRSLDSDSNKLFESLFEGLFPKHQYGQQTILGSIEDLKNPSLNELYKFFKKYYVPNNMAICLSGDLNYDKTFNLINQYWGDLKRKKLPSFNVIDEKPILKPVKNTVFGPQFERLYLAFRLDGANTYDSLMIYMVDMILSNTCAGLIDLNLNQKQKLIEAGSFPYVLKDYSVHTIYARAKKNQSLNNVKTLLLEQINEIKKGNFDDWLLDAIVLDFKLNQIKKYEDNSGLVSDFVDAFTLGISWKDYGNQIKRIESIKKKDVIDFVNSKYKDNYVVVHKKYKDEKKSTSVFTKHVSSFCINPNIQSLYFNSLISEKVKNINPVFLNFNKDLTHDFVGKIPLVYKKNIDNKRFILSYVYDVGKDDDKNLPFALDYFMLLGTKNVSLKEKAQFLYKLGCEINVKCLADKVEIKLSGLSNNFQSSVLFLEQLLTNIIEDEDVLSNLKLNTLKKRSDDKLDKEVILWKAMVNYAKYGSNSSFTNVLTNNELKNIKSKELITSLRKLIKYNHKIYYYGPEKSHIISAKLREIHDTSDNFLSFRKRKIFKEKNIKDKIVYFVDYNMKQAEVIVLSRGFKFNISKQPLIKLHNEYFSEGMNSIIFQDLRESKALAYSVYASFLLPERIDNFHYFVSYLGTQNDKLSEALSSIYSLLDNMPCFEKKLENSKEAVKQKIRSERITRFSLIKHYEKLNKLNINYDIRRDIYSSIDQIDMFDLQKFHKLNISNKNRSILVLGSLENIDLNILKRYGRIEHLSLKKIFGY